MSKFNERLQKNIKFATSGRLSKREAVEHLYLWFRFEHAERRSVKANRKLNQIYKKLNDNLDVYQLRLQMSLYEHSQEKHG